MEGGDEARHEVLLHLYDLSNGMARTMSAALLGKQIEGIWHTGVVVHGIEWYFGGGVQRSAPGRTPYGAPVRVIPLGRTAIDAAVVEDFMRDMSGKYTAETYSLLRNNCNNYSDEVASFLVGQGIPEFITGLPADVLSTPMGQMFAPMIEQMEASMRAQGGGDVGLGLSNGFGNGAFGAAAAPAPSATTATAPAAAAVVATAPPAAPAPTTASGSGPAGGSDAVQGDALHKGQAVWYTDGSGRKHAATIAGVHRDELPPYYTVTGDGIGERQTVRDRLAPRDSAADARAARAEAAEKRARASQLQQQKDQKAAIEAEFARIMAGGKHTANEAAVEALKRVKRRAKGQ